MSATERASQRLFQRAQALALALGDDVRQHVDAEDTSDVKSLNMMVLCAAQIMIAHCMGVFQKLDIPLEPVSGVYGQVMSHSDESLQLFLNAASTHLALVEGDAPMEVLRFATNAAVTSGGDHQVALVRLLAANEFIIASEKIDAATLESLREQARVLHTEAEQLVEDYFNEPKTNTTGGEA